MHTVYTYGTLRTGHFNHHMMRDAVLIGEDSIKAKKVTVVRCLPGITAGDDDVEGELYHVSATHLAELDSFEGSPTFYERREVVTNGGVKAWAYYPNPDAITGDGFPDVRNTRP